MLCIRASRHLRANHAQRTLPFSHAATLDLPLGEPAAFSLFAHCFTCGEDILTAKCIAERLAVHGIAVLRFDFTGLGGSEGEFANAHFSSNVDDRRCG